MASGAAYSPASSSPTVEQLTPLTAEHPYVFRGAPYICTDCPGCLCMQIVGGQPDDGEPLAPVLCSYTGGPAQWRQAGRDAP
jgi:hypothetical protein